MQRISLRDMPSSIDAVIHLTTLKGGSYLTGLLYKLMPELARFMGMIIAMRFYDTGEHNKPHVHVSYG